MFYIYYLDLLKIQSEYLLLLLDPESILNMISKKPIRIRSNSMVFWILGENLRKNYGPNKKL